MRLIQVGMGGWGDTWRREVLPGAPGVEVVAYVDQNPARLAEIADPAGPPVYTSLAEAAGAVRADAALVTADASAHAALVGTALDLGLHVLVEKPFVETAETARGLIGEADRRNLTIVVSQNYRYWAVPQQVRAIIAAGGLGDVRLTRIAFRKPFPPRPPEYLARLMNSPLYQLAIHHCDLVRYLLGDIAWVNARPWPGGAYPPYFAYSAHLGLVSGGIVEYSLAAFTGALPPTPWSGDWTIEGSAGAVSWAASGGTENEARLELRGLPDVPPPAHPPEPLDRAATLAEFVRVVRDGGPSPISATANLGSLAAVEAIRRSIDEDRRVDVGDL